MNNYRHKGVKTISFYQFHREIDANFVNLNDGTKK
jgi:hypothetical protein